MRWRRRRRGWCAAGMIRCATTSTAMVRPCVKCTTWIWKMCSWSCCGLRGRRNNDAGAVADDVSAVEGIAVAAAAVRAVVFRFAAGGGAHGGGERAAGRCIAVGELADLHHAELDAAVSAAGRSGRTDDCIEYLELGSQGQSHLFARAADEAIAVCDAQAGRRSDVTAAAGGGNPAGCSDREI